MKWGVIESDATHVVRKFVCFNERNALRRGRVWKRQHPEHVVRAVSLLPGDTTPCVVIAAPAGHQRWDR